MVVSGKKGFSDREVQKILSAGAPGEEEMDDTQLYLAALSDWTLNVNNNSRLFEQGNLPALVGVVAYA